MPRRPILGLIKLVAISAAVLLIASASVSAIAIAQLGQQLAGNTVDISGGGPVPGISAAEGSYNLLIVGTDNDKNQGDSFGEREATFNDVNILLHVAEDHKSAVVVSFPRDLLVEIPECTDPETDETFDALSRAMINNAYDRGGLACVVPTIENLTGLEIPYAGAISFNGVIAMTDAIGGVPVCLAGRIDDEDSGLHLDEGMNTIQGGMALAFLRNRHGVANGSDLGRITSQQQYMSSLMRTMKSGATLGNPVKLYGLAQAATRNMKLSSSLGGVDTMVSLALSLKDIDLERMTFVQYPTTPAPSDPNRVVPVPDLAERLMAKIAADEQFLLGADALGDYTEHAPGTGPTPTDEPTPKDEPAPETTAPTTPPGPETLDHVLGNTAAEQTCAIPN